MHTLPHFIYAQVQSCVLKFGIGLLTIGVENTYQQTVRKVGVKARTPYQTQATI
jgi:hypothetical protein